jgi:hypothetical protein
MGFHLLVAVKVTESLDEIFEDVSNLICAEFGG